jgi:hypothetical protein
MDLKIGFSDGLALVGIAATILLVVFDKAGKLKGGPLLLFLLGIAILMVVPLAIGNSWVLDVPSVSLKFSRAALCVCVLGVIYSLLAIWISSSEAQIESQKAEPQTTAQQLNKEEKPPTLRELFKNGFPYTMKSSDNEDAMTVGFKDGSSVKIARQAYMDFGARSKFVGFFVNQPQPHRMGLCDGLQHGIFFDASTVACH